MSKSSISLKGTTDPAALAQMLEDLARGIRAGTVCLRKGGEFVTLKPGGNLQFEIEAAEKKGKQKLEVSVKWEEPCRVANSEDIRISSEAPEAPPASLAVPDVDLPVIQARDGGAETAESREKSGEKPEKREKPKKHDKHDKQEKHEKHEKREKVRKDEKEPKDQSDKPDTPSEV